jgi:hypothetical protein
MLRTFSVLTTDTRYRVPALTLVVAENEASAIRMAASSLDASDYHVAVEVREGKGRIYRASKSIKAKPEEGPRPPETA